MHTKWYGLLFALKWQKQGGSGVKTDGRGVVVSRMNKIYVRTVREMHRKVSVNSSAVPVFSTGVILSSSTHKPGNCARRLAWWITHRTCVDVLAATQGYRGTYREAETVKTIGATAVVPRPGERTSERMCVLSDTKHYFVGSTLKH